MTDEVIKADSEKVSDTVTTFDGTVISNSSVASIDRNIGLLISDDIITISKDNKKKIVKNKCSLQIYTMNELNKLLCRNGFQVIEQYTIDTYTFHEDNQGYAILIVAKKK